MSDTVLKPTPARGQDGGGRKFFADLKAAATLVKEKKRRGWYTIARFGKPQRAHWYQQRLTRFFGGQLEFSASTAKGVGKLLCRLPTQIQAVGS